MPTATEKRREFQRLHESGCFVLPNPWDTGSTHYLQGLGFKALATTSAGAAWAMGYADGDTPLQAMLDHIRHIVEATDLPVNADFEHGYADAPDEVAANVRRCIETGVAGLSVEDSTGRREQPLYEIADAAARIRTVRAAIDASKSGVVLTGRAENFLVGRPDLADAIARAKAYAEAGADCLYIPGVRTREQIEAVIQAVAPKPVNILVGHASEFTVADIAAMGARRISVGSGLSRVAWSGFMTAARGIAEAGRFDGFAGGVTNADLNRVFKENRAKRGRP